MEAKAVTMIKDLDVSAEDIMLKVRIIRLWRLPDHKIPNQDYSIEMILVDEEGTRIQGSVLRKWFFRFEQYLQDNACIFIKNPSLGINTSKNKYVENQNKVCLNYQTHLFKCGDFNGAEFGFQFASFRAILDKEIRESFILDVIGHVTKIFPNDKERGKEAAQKKRLTMQIEDLEGNRVFLTLWDAYVSQLEKYISENANDEHVVVIMQFGRVKWFNGNPYVQNTFGGQVSRLFINNDIDDIRKYKNSLLKRAADTSSDQRPIRLSMICSLDDEFLKNCPFTSIFEICEIIEEKHVIILGTIKAICQDAGWKYNACKKCNRKVVRKWMPRLKADGSEDLQEEQIDYCTKCCARIETPIPKLKIQVRVQDLTGVVSITLFDRDVTKLVQTTAVELIEKNQKAIEEDILYFPEVFNSLLDKKFAFKIEVGQYNLRNNYPVYGVVKFTEQSSILTELEKRHNMLQPNESESFNMSLSEFHSQDTVANKEPLSYIGGNETPLSSVKRNLVDLYEIEEGSSLSAIKTQRIDVDDKEDDDVKVKLLTPKLEKTGHP